MINIRSAAALFHFVHDPARHTALAKKRTYNGKQGQMVLLFSVMSIALTIMVPSTQASAKPKSFTLWQLPEQTHSQMMSYAIRTAGGKLIVIDGGTEGDADYLRKFIVEQGGHVDVWFFTHPHSDHVGAPIEILKDPKGITVDKIYASNLKVSEVQKYEPSSAHTQAEIDAVVKETNRRMIELTLGAKLIIDGVHFDILGIKNPEIHANYINNSSIVMRVWDAEKSVIFLGDLGPEGGSKLLAGPYGKKLKSDYCQMAHHGQSGVRGDVYQAIQPKYCLWTTPKWLWENDQGGGYDTGPWTTMETRKWADELQVKRNYATWKDGLVKID